MSTTLRLRSLPENSSGISLTKPTATSWEYSPWKIIAPKTNEELLVYGIEFSTTVQSGADVTVDVIFEIGIGDPGYEILRAQVPFSFRNDTAVGYYLSGQKIFFPEQFTVAKTSTVSVRYTHSLGTPSTYNGIKLLVMVNTRPVQPNEQLKVENNQNIKVGNGMSVSERGGCFR